MTDHGRRQLAAAVFFVASILALVATTPGPPTARADASGEFHVAPGEPARVEARFTVPNPAPEEIVRVAVNRIVGYDPDARFEVVVAAGIVGWSDPELISPSSHDLSLDPNGCTGGCDVVATIDAAWLGSPAAGVRVAWTLELEVEYRNTVPGDALAASVTSGDEAPPRLTWLALGASLAVAVGIGLWLARPRLIGLRLLLAAGLLAAAAWPIVTLGPYLERWLASRLIIGSETVAIAVAATLLAIAVAVAIARAIRGRATLLRVVGWIAALLIGYVWWAVAMNFGTYRPHELTAITAALGVFVAAAVTAEPMAGATAPRRTAGPGTSLVMAVQALLLCSALLAAGAGFVALVLSLAGGRPPDLGSLGLTLALIALAALFTFGWLDWRRGSMRNILIANAVALVAALGLGTAVLAQGEGSFLSIGVELRVLAALVMATVVIGAIGLRVVDPPVAYEEWDGEAGQGDEVAGVSNEENRARLDDGP